MMCGCEVLCFERAEVRPDDTRTDEKNDSKHTPLRVMCCQKFQETLFLLQNVMSVK